MAIAIVVAIVLIASALLILRPNPEEVVTVSQDNVLRVEGVTRSSSLVLIERLDSVETSIPNLVSPIYEVSLTDSGTLQKSVFTFSFPALSSDLSIQDVMVYQFSRETLSWEVVPTFFELDTQTLTSAVEFSGSVLVGLGTRVL